MPPQNLLEPENDLRNVDIEDEEAHEADKSDARAAEEGQILNYFMFRMTKISQNFTLCLDMDC